MTGLIAVFLIAGLQFCAALDGDTDDTIDGTSTSSTSSTSTTSSSGGVTSSACLITDACIDYTGSGFMQAAIDTVCTSWAVRQLPIVQVCPPAVQAVVQLEAVQQVNTLHTTIQICQAFVRAAGLPFVHKPHQKTYKKAGFLPAFLYCPNVLLLKIYSVSHHAK